MVGVVVGSCVPLNNTVQSALDAPERDNSSSADDISQGSKKKVVERDVIYLFFLLFKKGGGGRKVRASLIMSHQNLSLNAKPLCLVHITGSLIRRDEMWMKAVDARRER